MAQTALKYRKCYEEQQTLFDRWLLTANVVKKATIRSGSSYMPPITPQWLDRVFRILYLGTYYLLIAGWLFAAVFIHRGWIWLLPAVVLLVGIFKVSSVIEHRYFLTIFPFVILGFVQCLLYFGQYLESDKKAV